MHKISQSILKNLIPSYQYFNGMKESQKTYPKIWVI